METKQYIQLPDGSYVAIEQTITTGEAIIALLLFSILLLFIYQMWRRL